MARPRTGIPYLDEGVDEGGILAFAHRGGAAHPETARLENTLKAFEHAMGLGYRYLETDVHASSDGVVLAFHDARLDRMFGRPERLSDLPYAELAQLLVDGREPIPRLEDLLDALPEARFNIDVKGRSAVRPLAELIERTGSRDRVCVGSFNEVHLRRFRSVAPHVPTSRGVMAATVRALLPGADLVEPLLRDPGPVYQVPIDHGGVRVVDRRFVEQAHARGRHVHVWTVNDPDDMRMLVDLGVDGIISDGIAVLREVLLDAGAWIATPGGGT